jgi:hypothetical protein
MDMDSKVLIVRDRGTRYVVIATHFTTGGITPIEAEAIELAGLGEGSSYKLQLTDLEDGRTERDSFRWRNSGRTLYLAHGYLELNWSLVRSGDTIHIDKMYPEQ